MQLTRKEIVDYLDTHHTATSLELSRALHLSPADIRHHLAVLQAEGVIETTGYAPQEGRGRPMYLYRLRTSALDHHLDGLADALLRALLDNLDAATADARLEALARQFLGPSPSSDTNPTRRLNKAIQRLNELRYRARWEAYAAGPRLILGYCPYAAILPEHPELCRMDARLLTLLTGRAASQTARLERILNGAPACSFVLERAAGKPDG